MRKIMKELTGMWIITIAINHRIFKVVFIMFYLFFNIGKLGIKLIVFSFRAFPRFLFCVAILSFRLGY